MTFLCVFGATTTTLSCQAAIKNILLLPLRPLNRQSQKPACTFEIEPFDLCGIIRGLQHFSIAENSALLQKKSVRAISTAAAEKTRLKLHFSVLSVKTS